MALRVLLADESSTIKKVMQLALQDFNVEVKAVPVGIDVLDVAKSYDPDIVFADVLLAKKNGYEVCAELKADVSLHKVPVVLMWSGFMEIDERKVTLAKPDRRLEKPFDADTLRKLVKDLVPKVNTNAISQYLSFPNLPEIEDDQRAKAYMERKAGMTKPSAHAPLSEQKPLLTNPDTEEEDVEDFQSVPLPQLVPKSPGRNENKDSWSHQDLAQFKVSLREDDLTSAYEKAGDDLTKSHVAMSSGLEEISLEDLDLSEPLVHSEPPPQVGAKSTAAPPPKPQALSSMDDLAIKKPLELPSMTQISHERMEQILRDQVREVLENIAWKLIPDIAERIVREEVQKLMKDAERL